MPGETVPLTRIISGGQTGVDRAALNVAIELGIAHGGWCPRGRIAEDGRIDERYRLQETATENYNNRTFLNVRDSDGTLILNSGALTGGTALTAEYARESDKPLLILPLESPPDNNAFYSWLLEHRINVLNIAGPRASKKPGIQLRAEYYLFRLLRP